MINEERVKHMTAMAIFEKELGPEYQPMLRYSRKEYIALHGWGGFLGGTVFFGVVYITFVLYLIGEVLEDVTTMYILLIGLVGLLLYAAYIIMHVYYTRRRAARDYKRGKRLIKLLAEQYHTLNVMYEDERQQTRPIMARDKSNIEEE